MSERQRIINKYVTNLTPAVGVRYQLFFLQHETDEPARHMLKETLSQIAKDIANTDLQNIITEVCKSPHASIRFGKHVSKKSKNSEGSEQYALSVGNKATSKIDYAQRGQGQLSSLQLEDALKSFQKAKSEQKGSSHIDGFYKQRSEINLVLQNYGEALSLAKKGGIHDTEFVSAIAAGNFDYASKMADVALNTSLRSHEKYTIITTYEMVHLVLFVAMATMSTTQIDYFLQRIRKSANFDLPFLFDLAQSFINRRFSDVIKNLKELKRILELSIFTFPVAQKLVDEIIANVVVNSVLPYAKIRFDTLVNDTKLSENDIVNILLRKIRAGVINGKLDLVEKSFIGGVSDTEIKNMINMYENVLSIQYKTNQVLWQYDFNIRCKKIK